MVLFRNESERRHVPLYHRQRLRPGHRWLRDQEALPPEQEGSTPLSERFEEQPWYPEWRAVVDRVVTARIARDSAAAGTPEREAADREYDAAFAAFQSAAELFR